MSALLTAALALAERGWPVFPCNPAADKAKGKQPLIAKGFKGASTDPDTIRTWWREHPDALIGLSTGRDLGAFVVDLDPREDDCETLWRRLEEHIGAELGEPVVAITQSGGWHLYFAWPDLPQGAKLGNRGGLIPHVDVRGAGGYVIALPSVMSDGRTYTWRRRADGERGLTAPPAPSLTASSEGAPSPLSGRPRRCV
ncbi:bifunctional DNA primase/polymerase [Acuticoccus mangrovi]|uniref:Bifunctional DNA primase/polymerase n=1 Tax=Acuticoccus mangrovi TaxID=2796142 RepID=A0A934IL41_9HYPH|nr:bifunctional DNA primase/polymerase [Acuticoccus mangrovi]MBJ3774336.1 bifunctional DNA primase/polymerase [Acuticoccus mangrovi]